jgi:2-C-methyl-D-erythritol 4-phosphate cytidylyltransferase
MATVGAVIVGAGRGERIGDRDKVFLALDGRPLLAYSVAAFNASRPIQFIALVLAEHQLDRGRALVDEWRWRKVVAVCAGGERRQDSVRAGLAALPPCDLVAVHDAARPLVTTDLIRRGVEAATATGAAIAAVPVKDTIKRVGSDGLIVETPPREALWMAQTPQVARRDALERAYAFADERGLATTDEAGLLEAAGFPVAVYAGSYDNLKVTTPEDLAMAAALLSSGP